MDLEQWNMSQISQIDSVAHGLMRYRLIDILANVLDCKKNPKRKSFAAVQTPILPPRVQGVSAVTLCENEPLTLSLADSHFSGQLASCCPHFQGYYPPRWRSVFLASHQPLPTRIVYIFPGAGCPVNRAVQLGECRQEHPRYQILQGDGERAACSICPLLVWNGMFQTCLTCC